MPRSHALLPSETNRRELQNRGVGLYITHIKRSVRESFERAGIVQLLGEANFLKDVSSAMARIEQSTTRERI